MVTNLAEDTSIFHLDYFNQPSIDFLISVLWLVSSQHSTRVIPSKPSSYCHSKSSKDPTSQIKAKVLTMIFKTLNDLGSYYFSECVNSFPPTSYPHSQCSSNTGFLAVSHIDQRYFHIHTGSFPYLGFFTSFVHKASSPTSCRPLFKNRFLIKVFIGHSF